MTSAFVSYRWEDGAHNQWVHRFCNDLRRQYGIDAKVDEFEVGPGDSFIEYMTRGIHSCDYMLFVVTPSSVKAVEESRGGLYFELQLGLARQIAGDPFKIIPILREGSQVPLSLRSQRYVDFRDDSIYERSLTYLAQWIGGSEPSVDPRRRPPPVLNKRWLQVKAELYYACALLGRKAFSDGVVPGDIAEEISNLKYVRIDSGSYRVCPDGLTFRAYCVSGEKTDDATLADIDVTVRRHRDGAPGTRITSDITASFRNEENGKAQQQPGGDG